jgi:hypothetical protein
MIAISRNDADQSEEDNIFGGGRVRPNSNIYLISRSFCLPILLIGGRATGLNPMALADVRVTSA